MAGTLWTVHAVKYADRNARTRGDSFLLDATPEVAHPMDYFMWVLESEGRRILVDTGYDAAEGAARGRPIRLDPAEALAPLGLVPAGVDTVICTHLHYDHAGGLHLFPGADLHLQAAEMAYATGPCMCHDHLRMPFTGAHVCEAVRRLHAGRVVFHDGDGQVAPGVRVVRIGGHSKGLQAVVVDTASGPLVLASDAAHFWENALDDKPFPIVVDVAEMLEGFATLRRLAGRAERLIPGHDPLVMARFPEGPAPHVRRLDAGPLAPFD